MTSPLTRYDLGAAPAALSEGAIAETPDLARVRGLKQRAPIDEATVDAMSRALCKDPKERLRPHQAMALREFYQTGGLVAPIRVGGGKTLITLLAPRMLGARKALIVTKADLRDECRLEYVKYRDAGWAVELPDILSYSELGRQSAEHKLLRAEPDLIMFDEAHKLKNLKSASSVRRVARAIVKLRPRVAMLSGSMVGDKLMEYWHLLCWALGAKAPVPLAYEEAQRWALALDTEWDPMKAKMDLGALSTLPGGFHEHMRSCEGFVPTIGGDCPAKIVCGHWRPELPPELQDMIESVDASGIHPINGVVLEDSDKADAILQLSQGFIYHWDPHPPDTWLEPRADWAKYVRAVLELHIDGFDSPAMVIAALDGTREESAGRFIREIKPEYVELENSTDEELPEACYEETWIPPAPAQELLPPEPQIGRALLAAWRAVEPTFVPNTVTKWIDDSPLRQAVEQAPAGTLIWTRHSAAGLRMQQLGVPYFGGGGVDPRHGHRGRTVALSISAHGTGKNLQDWNKNLFLVTPANPNTTEQAMGRTHRPGNKSDQVSFAFAVHTEYQEKSLASLRARARTAGSNAGIEYKITRGVWS